MIKKKKISSRSKFFTITISAYIMSIFIYVKNLIMVAFTYRCLRV
jgi:hypothetical protein